MIEGKPVGLKQLKADMLAAAERGKDPSPAFREMADEFRESEKDYLGRAKWAPLSPAYAARKARMGRGTQVGVYTGGLVRSLTQEGDRYHYERVTRDRLEVGTKNPVARLFDKGTSRQPKRRLVRIPAKKKRAMISGLTDYLLDPLR